MADASLGIGKIFGVAVELHWTFIALLLITLLLSPYAFVLIALLFVCVLIHELLHCIVSMRNGINVRKIILLPIGGASIIDQVSIAPEVEFNVAIAGPLMSLLLGVAFGAMVVIAPPGIANQILQFLRKWAMSIRWEARNHYHGPERDAEEQAHQRARNWPR